MIHEISYIRLREGGEAHEDVTHVWTGEELSMEEVLQRMDNGDTFWMPDPENAGTNIRVGAVRAEAAYISAYAKGGKIPALLGLPRF